MRRTAKGWIILFGALGALALIAFAAVLIERKPFLSDGLVPLLALAAAVCGIVYVSRDRMLPEICQARYSKIIGLAFTSKGQRTDHRRLLNAAELYHSSRYSRSLRLLERLELRCKRDSDYAAVYAFMGLNHARLNDPAKAARFYRNSLAYKPNQDNILSNLCVMLTDSGKPEEAVEAAEKAISCNSMNPYAHGNLAHALLRCERFEEAADAALRAHELNGCLPSPVITLCLASLRMGKTAESRRCYDLALSLGADRAKLIAAILRHKRIMNRTAASVPEAQSSLLSGGSETEQ